MNEFTGKQVVVSPGGVSYTVYEDVPDRIKGSHAQQAPQGSFPGAGMWWLGAVPFNREPWRVMTGAGDFPGAHADGFIDAIGPQPDGHSHPDQSERWGAIQEWRQQRDGFVRLGLPSWADFGAVMRAFEMSERFGLGPGTPFQGMYGWTVRFRQSALPEYDMPVKFLADFPIQAIVAFQARMIDRKIKVEPASHVHPNLPDAHKKANQKL